MPDITPRLFTLEEPSEDQSISKRARSRRAALGKRRAELGELNIQTEPIYGPRGPSTRLKEVRRNVQGAKLGMTIQPQKKTPYDQLDARLGASRPEQARLEQRGDALLGPAARRTQKRIPRITPTPALRVSRQGA